MLPAEEEETESHPRRCPYHPFRKTLCPGSCRSLEAAADCTVILAYWKLRDGAADKGFFGALGCKIACLALKRHYKKASAFRPDFAASAEENLHTLAQLEKAETASVDAVADCFAKLLCAAVPETLESAKNRILRELLYHLGRIVYILDAVDDLSEDVRDENYNPLRYRFVLKGDALSEADELTLRESLQLSHNCLCGAYALMEESPYSPILANILYRGLPAVTQAVFAGTWKTSEKSKRERSRI